MNDENGVQKILRTMKNFPSVEPSGLSWALIHSLLGEQHDTFRFEELKFAIIIDRRRLHVHTCFVVIFHM